MTGNELIEKLSADLGMTKKDVKAIVDGVFTAIGDAAAKGDEIAINGFGKFSVKRTPARDGRNPRTGEPMTIKAANKIGFRPAKALKDKLNGRSA
ncbi:HU family DNA-binding protein [Altererythrobacter sp. N1]|nr:HU family DNA-binding protein [Altererythrobacter sp. N1]|tara:strand:+ start:943 stop:1227 length:285 start_codon:yes stop_codon:yes gene_type:complete